MNKIIFAAALLAHVSTVASAGGEPSDTPMDMQPTDVQPADAATPDDAPVDVTPESATPPKDNVPADSAPADSVPTDSVPEDSPVDITVPEDSEPAPIYCTSNALCRKNGDNLATCVNGNCTCGTGFEILTVNGNRRERDGCYRIGTDPATIIVERFLVFRFGEGLFSRLTPALRNFLIAFLRALFRYRVSVWRQGSIIVGAVGDVSLAAADNVEPAAILSSWANSVNGSAAARQVFGSPSSVTVEVSSQGATDCPAVTGVAAQLRLGADCVAFTCVKGWVLSTVDPVHPVCVKQSSDDDLSPGAIAAITVGSVLFVGIIVIVVFFYVIKQPDNSASTKLSSHEPVNEDQLDEA